MLLLLLNGSGAEAEEDIVYPTPAAAALTFRFEMYLLGVWVDATADVDGSAPLVFSRGNRSNGPEDLVSMPGNLSVTLDNSVLNSAGLEGYYSPNHPNCRPGFDFGTPVRVVLVKTL